MRPTLKLAVASLLALAASPALAAPTPQSAQFTVSANVIRSCTVSASSLELGTYDPMAAADLAPGTGSTIRVNCTRNTTFTIAPLTNANGVSGAGEFQMVSGAAHLNYRLYQEGTHSTDWSTVGSGGTSANVSTPVTFNVFGVVPAGQDVPGGAYSDTVTVSVTF